jgi:hypothetical protein
MRLVTSLTAVVICGLTIAAASAAENFPLTRSLSGPSGKVQGSKFVFDDVRSRFVYPQAKSFVVYFEWERPTGFARDEASLEASRWKRGVDLSRHQD